MQKEVDNLSESIESSIRQRKIKIMEIIALKQQLVSVGIAVTFLLL